MIISVGLISWNCLNDISQLVPKIFEEIKNDVNNTYVVTIVDNGSDDGSREYLSNIKNANILLLDKNYGISVAKNKFIQLAVENKSKYMFMFDSDILPINNSFPKMIQWMEENPNVACLGQNINFYTKDKNDERIPETFPDSLDIELNVKNGIGTTRTWAHYSIYRTEIFKKGIMFDAKGPFGQAGYGFDDDDLGLQISNQNYDIACFKNVYIYHNINSSIESLKIKDTFNYSDREKYFYEKWNIIL